jgi:FkbM family methyltransferase
MLGFVKKIKSLYRKIVPEKIRDILWNIRNPKKKEMAVDYAFSNEMKFNVIPNIFWGRFNNCLWEQETIRFYRNNVSPDKEVIDIGGWIGPTMLIAYSYNPQKIYVVEADPSNYQILKQNTFNNYLDDKVKLFNICISDKDDEIVSFGYNDENIKNTSTKGIGGTRVKVKTKTLENFLQTLDMSKINIIKIDTEGGEQYMENGLKYISKYSGIKILFSIHTPFWTNKTETANMLIKQFENYDVFTENEEKITENELMGRMLNEKPTVYNDKTGVFFTLILKTKIC